MTRSTKELQTIHAHACAAVAIADRSLSPIDAEFWPAYLSAALSFDSERQNADRDRLDWLDRHSTSSFDWESASLTFPCPGEFEPTNYIRDVIDHAIRIAEEKENA
jgi:hypothetical protein